MRRGNVNVHRDQGIVERFSLTLGERLFAFQYSQEMNFKERKRSTEWEKRLPAVVSALNNEVTRLTGKKPVMPLMTSRLTPRVQRLTQDLLAWRKRDSTPRKKWDISLPLTSWKEVKEEQQIPCDLWKSSKSIEHLWIRMSLFSTIWRMDQSVVSSDICRWKNRNDRFIHFFVKICNQNSLHWDIHQGKINVLVSHRPQLKQWSTSSK